MAVQEALDVLLVDDDADVRASVGDALISFGHRVARAASEQEAISVLDSRVFDVVISDVNLKRGKGGGLAIFRHVHATAPSTRVILITGYGSVADAVTALKEGAHDYLTKPFDIEVIAVHLARIGERLRLERDFAALRAATAASEPRTKILGQTPAMVRLLERIGTMAASDAPVLITGESGTGKELVAHSLHARSPRATMPFVAVNCAAFPEGLLEAELFGHEKGAFTGAVRRRDGRFAAAHGGTLFLDEVAEIPPLAQVKLLRVLQDGVVERLGANEGSRVDVRVITATHRDLKARIAQGLFREDLYYRLKVLDIAIPALRERRSDIPVLVQHSLKRVVPPGAPVPVFSPRAWAALNHYAFPGNVRELQHAIEHAVVLAQGREIDLEHLPSEIAGIEPAVLRGGSSIRPLSLAMKEFEREYLVRALAVTGGKKALAAESLGISRKNLWEKLKGLGINDPDPSNRAEPTGDPWPVPGPSTRPA